MSVGLVLALLALMLLAYLAGVLSFRRVNRRCPQCGETTNDLRVRMRADEGPLQCTRRAP